MISHRLNLLLLWLFFWLCPFYSRSEDRLVLMSRTQTSYLEKYQSYKDVLMVHMKVPQDTIFASFKFTADETELRSLIAFGCKPRNISLYLKHGAPPVINPDGSPFPKDFRDVNRSETYRTEFRSDKKEVYINVTSPEPGYYYAATFLSYSDPKFNKITQQGLSPNCFANVEAILNVIKLDNPLVIAENDKNELIARPGESRYFKFYVPSIYDRAAIYGDINKLSENVTRVVLRVGVNKPPSNSSFESMEYFNNNGSIINMMFWTRPDCWHYIEWKFENNDSVGDSTTKSNISFSLRFYTDKLPENLTTRFDFLENKTMYNNSLTKTLHTAKLTDLVPYKQYDLIRESSSETFLFSYQLQEELVSNLPVPINMTNDHFSTLKFRVKDGTDIGGTLQFIIAFKPKVERRASRVVLVEEPEGHSVVACIRKGQIEVPTWPSACVSGGISRPAQLILNKTTDNATILIPYPEAGVWYATFRLFCGTHCVPCACSDSCQTEYADCMSVCQRECDGVGDECERCSANCSSEVVASDGCDGCDCDGPCLRNSTNSCNSSVIFDVGSHPCIFGRCSRNGRCMFMVSDGVVFSTCVCTNKYRGWDCSDGSQATAFAIVVLELVLLVLSNMAFLPGVYIAYKRKYYIESLVYFSICFFSTFYHACDAGEKIISFCLVRIDALQFGDFFCALLAIWVTLIAMADMPQLWTSVCHMGGAIILAFCVTINKAALWIFALPSITGILIVAARWYLKYRKVRQRFGNKRYLTVQVPLGMTMVGVGLVLYAFLQTEDNYKYLHSLWHILMAIALVLVLPKPDTFHPEVLL